MRSLFNVSVVAGAFVMSACGGGVGEQPLGPEPAPDASGDAAMGEADASGDTGPGGEDVGSDLGGVTDAGPDASEDAGPSSSCDPVCSGDAPLCDEPRGECVGCLETSDCSGGAECDMATKTCVVPMVVPEADVNQDGTLNILVLGTSRSIEGGDPFASDQIAAELQSILTADADIDLTVNVVSEDMYVSKQVLVGLGSGPSEYTWNHSRHSLTQYYHWPEGIDARKDNLAGRGDIDWDHVVIGADPYIVATLPGYYALGANTIAARVAEGGAVPHLLMTWPRDETSIDAFVEHTRRVSDKARTPLPVIAAGAAWSGLPAGKKDTSAAHPTPNGSYLAAASIYARLYDRDASASGYTYDDALAQAAHDAYTDETARAPYTLPLDLVSPFRGAGVADRVLSYNQTGSSSERGIRGGLQWVLGKARVALTNGGGAPVTFNYGRANTNFEPNKRYEVDPSKFLFSMGFPMQDHRVNGDVSMLYGLDHRFSGTENGTDLGVARLMVRDAELPYARAIPIRTLFARMKELNPSQSAFRDAWHMSRDLDKAAGAFMYTLLTGHCALDAEPADVASDAWRQWMSHKVGYETAWTLMHLSGVTPCFKVLPEATESVSVTPTQSATLEISFMTPPTEDVTVTLSSDNDAVVTYAPQTLTFTPGDHDIPQVVTMTGVAGQPAGSAFVITARTSSAQVGFDSIEDRWRYTAEQD